MKRSRLTLMDVMAVIVYAAIGLAVIRATYHLGDVAYLRAYAVIPIGGPVAWHVYRIIREGRSIGEVRPRRAGIATLGLVAIYTGWWVAEMRPFHQYIEWVLRPLDWPPIRGFSSDAPWLDPVMESFLVASSFLAWQVPPAILGALLLRRVGPTLANRWRPSLSSPARP